MEQNKSIWSKNLRTDRKRFVSIQNFDFKTFTFDLFWNESRKWKLPILKDR